MKIVSLTVLHYGREWLEWALRSVQDLCDEMHIFYTPTPSHGHTTRAKCPDTREELHDIASVFSGVRWHDADHQFRHEGEHRDLARQVCEDAGGEVILVLDADEIWGLEDLGEALQQAWDGHDADVWKSRIQGHLWRSVNWVCTDASMPDRIIVPHHTKGYGALGGAGFWHLGYALAMETMIYKWKIHGHHNELRRGWYPEIYRDWEPGVEIECGVHPTCECDGETGAAFWTPKEFDRMRLVDLIGDHPYFSDELI